MIQIGKLQTVKDVKTKRVSVVDDSAFVEKTRKIQQPHTQELKESNSIKDVMENLDRDVIDSQTNLTTIDFNTRLTATEIGPLVALQMLHTLRVGGSSCSLIARSIKRHKVSLRGLGREEKVRIIQGEREQETGGSDTSLFGKMKGFMGGNNNEK